VNQPQRRNYRPKLPGEARWAISTCSTRSMIALPRGLRSAMNKIAPDRLWLLLPVGLLYGLLAVLPIGLIVRFSFDNGAEHYDEVLQSPLLLRAAENTVVISLITTIVALLLGYVLAAGLWRANKRQRNFLLAFILLPFWTAVLVKNFAWASLLQDNGPINNVLQALGITSAPVTLLHDRLAVIIGMVHYVLPYAVFPIYTSMRSIDQRVEHAARSLGATPPQVIWRIILPLTLPGITGAGLLVFIVSSGFFITPVILGAPSDMMVANLVDYYVHTVVDFGSAAALAIIILLAVLPLIVLQQLMPRESMHGRA
jgi:putative spermidine/putrescine transport system permease protein